MSDRFFVESPIHGQSASLVGQEASHLSKVLRARVGQDIVLFDGSGREYSARIADITRQEVRCDILETREINLEASSELILAVALPKGDRQRFLVEKLTELGVARLVPLITDRSVVQPDEGTVHRLSRFVIEASKQCGRNRLMSIDAPRRLSEVLARNDQMKLRLIAHPGISSMSPCQSSELLQERGPIQVCIGPEGGFAAGELDRAGELGWRSLQLGPRVLRVETAALAVAALVGCKDS